MNDVSVTYPEIELSLELKPARKPERKKKTGSGKIDSNGYQLDNNSEIIMNNSISVAV